MRNKLFIYGRLGEQHILEQQSPGKYSLKSQYIGVSYDPGSKEIISVDPPGGPYMVVGFEFKFRHQKYRIKGFSTLHEPLLIEIEEVN